MAKMNYSNKVHNAPFAPKCRLDVPENKSTINPRYKLSLTETCASQQHTPGSPASPLVQSLPPPPLCAPAQNTDKHKLITSVSHRGVDSVPPRSRFFTLLYSKTHVIVVGLFFSQRLDSLCIKWQWQQRYVIIAAARYYNNALKSD